MRISYQIARSEIWFCAGSTKLFLSISKIVLHSVHPFCCLHQLHLLPLCHCLLSGAFLLLLWCHAFCFAMSIAAWGVLLSVQCCMAASQGIALIAMFYMWFRLFIAPKSPSANHRLHCNLHTRLLLCSVLSCYLHQLQPMPLLAVRCDFAICLISGLLIAQVCALCQTLHGESCCVQSSMATSQGIALHNVVDWVHQDLFVVHAQGHCALQTNFNRNKWDHCHFKVAVCCTSAQTRVTTPLDAITNGTACSCKCSKIWCCGWQFQTLLMPKLAMPRVVIETLLMLMSRWHILHETSAMCASAHGITLGCCTVFIYGWKWKPFWCESNEIIIPCEVQVPRQRLPNVQRHQMPDMQQRII